VTLESPIFDLAALTLEATSLDRAEMFYNNLMGLETVRRDDEMGVLEMRLTNAQTLQFWMPITKQHNDARLVRLRARGGTHVHWAMQIPLGSREDAKRTLNAHGISWREIDLGDESFHDYGLYFFDPFGHGLELREVSIDENDPRAPVVGVGHSPAEARTLPVIGLREVALAFTDFPAMLERLPNAYGMAFAKQQEERAFAQFTLGPHAEPDGRHTPRRWLYAWDPQVGLADMLGGEHALVTFYADVDAVKDTVERAGLEYVHDSQGLAVRDPEGHIFEFIPLRNDVNISSTKTFSDRSTVA
jgi:catechol 2,3-dioxygenase-like lactoylglutathione lyase family enzyme